MRDKIYAVVGGTMIGIAGPLLKLSMPEKLSTMQSWISTVFNPFFVLGLFFNVTGAIIIMIALTVPDCRASIIAPFSGGFSYVVTAVGGYYLVHEPLPFGKIVSMGFIISGIFLLGRFG